MGTIGTFGPITFEVSDRTARTFQEMTYTATSRWAVHETLKGQTRSEFLGSGENELELVIQLSSQLGTDPRAEMEKIEAFIREGRHDLFMLGGRPIGQGEWRIENSDLTTSAVSGKGKINFAEMVLKMKEYF